MTKFITVVSIGLTAMLCAGQAHAWTADTSTNSDYSNKASRMTDPDGQTPTRFNADGQGGTTYNLGGSTFSVHMSGPQSNMPSQRDGSFTPAGQGSIGPQFNNRPRNQFPGQP
jgi:hypothetical protein